MPSKTPGAAPPPVRWLKFTEVHGGWTILYPWSFLHLSVVFSEQPGSLFSRPWAEREGLSPPRTPLSSG